MIQTTLKIGGMACGMCEAHINETVRRCFAVKKVTSSHSKGETVIVSEKALDHAKIKEEIEKTGYTVTEIAETAYEKKGLFSFLKNDCRRMEKTDEKEALTNGQK